MTTTETGRKAEQAACTYLEMRGYKIIEQNWRRPQCKIDIIAEKGDVAYFVEVKYRHTDFAGSGFEYITASKLKQMKFAALSWASEYKWHDDIRLSAVEIMGPQFIVMGYIDDVF